MSDNEGNEVVVTTSESEILKSETIVGLVEYHRNGSEWFSLQWWATALTDL